MARDAISITIVSMEDKTKPVRRNVSLPSWLNHAADVAGINVSKVLQEALINVLGITRKY